MEVKRKPSKNVAFAKAEADSELNLNVDMTDTSQKYFCPWEECEVGFLSGEFLRAHIAEQHIIAFSSSEGLETSSKASTKSEKSIEEPVKNEIIEEEMPEVIKKRRSVGKKSRPTARKSDASAEKKNTETPVKNNAEGPAKKRSRSWQKTFICDADGCDESFTSKLVMRQHKKETHGPSEDLKCHICGKQLAYKYALVKHVKNHSRVGDLLSFAPGNMLSFANCSPLAGRAPSAR